MTLREALQSVTQTLINATIDDARVEAELLLGHVLNMSRTQIYTAPERELTATETEHLSSVVRRRLDREPAAYIIGQCRFYDLEFDVDPRALIPRPETELLVEQAVELARHMHEPGRQISIADIGTGCGAIAVILALTLPDARIYATDVSRSALQLAERNCRRHGVDARIHLLAGDLLEPLPQPVNIIVANLPYVRNADLATLSPEIRDFEPEIALAGGEDGLDRIREILEQMPAKLNDDACLLLEIGYGQGDAVTSLIKERFPQATIELTPDLGGIPRVVMVVLQSSAGNRRNSDRGKE